MIRQMAMAAAVAMGSFGMTAGAAIITGETATASSEIYYYNRPAVAAVNDSGLSASGPTGTHGTNPNHMWLTYVPGAGAGSGVDSAPWYQVDLGNTFNLASIHVWNYNEVGQSGRGIKGVNIQTKINAGDAWTTRSTPQLAVGNGSVETLPFLFTARYVRFEVTSNQAGNFSVGTGLSEVQFDGTPVPEPATLGLLAVGALVGLRRRRQA